MKKEKLSRECRIYYEYINVFVKALRLMKLCINQNLTFKCGLNPEIIYKSFSKKFKIVLFSTHHV